MFAEVPSINRVCGLAVCNKVKYTLIVLHERGKASFFHLGCGGPTEEAFKFFSCFSVLFFDEAVAADF